jgi:hypothetical protein
MRDHPFPTGSPNVYHWNTNDMSRVVPTKLLVHLGITEESFLRTYPFLLTDAIRNVAVYHQLRLPKQAARWLSKLTLTSRKLYLCFASALDVMFNEEYQQYRAISEILDTEMVGISILPEDNPAFPQFWEVPTDWDTFCSILRNMAQSWVTEYSFNKIARAMRTTANRDYDAHRLALGEIELTISTRASAMTPTRQPLPSDAYNRFGRCGCSGTCTSHVFGSELVCEDCVAPGGTVWDLGQVCACNCECLGCLWSSTTTHATHASVPELGRLWSEHDARGWSGHV